MSTNPKPHGNWSYLAAKLTRISVLRSLAHHSTR